MTMHINLSPEMESFIKAKVGSGFYANATDVIRDAIRRMQTDDQKSEALRAAVAKGEDSLKRGGKVPYTKEMMQNISRKAAARSRTKNPAKPDVSS